MDDILVEESQKRVTSAATGKNQQFLKGFWRMRLFNL